jgi:hypothetical protein
MRATYLKKIGTFFCEGLRPIPPKRKKSPCVPIPSKIVKNPDPAIYDQYLEFKNDRPFSFNSPDIDTVNIWPVTPIPKIRVTVRNLSNETSAINTRINVSWSPWGIGLERKQLGSTTVNLSRAGKGGSEVSVFLTTPEEVIEAKRYGIFVDVVHPFDKNASNNHGEQTVDGFATSEKREGVFIIPVRNSSSFMVNIDLHVRPEKWDATVTPSSLILSPGAQENVMFSVKVPSSIPPPNTGISITETFEVYATIGNELLGGVSILVLIDK